MARARRVALDVVKLAAGYTSGPQELQGLAFAIELAVDFTPDAQSPPGTEMPQE